MPRILEATGGGGENLFETSTSCIGVPICQQGLGCSQWLLSHCIERVRKENFPDGVLPRIHISGCPSGCGTHQAASLGFMGCRKKIRGETVPAFRVFINGQAQEPGSRIGEEAGILPEEVIPEFLAELGKTIQKSHKTFWGFPTVKSLFIDWCHILILINRKHRCHSHQFQVISPLHGLSTFSILDIIL